MWESKLRCPVIPTMLLGLLLLRSQKWQLQTIPDTMKGVSNLKTFSYKEKSRWVSSKKIKKIQQASLFVKQSPEQWCVFLLPKEIWFFGLRLVWLGWRKSFCKQKKKNWRLNMKMKNLKSLWVGRSKWCKNLRINKSKSSLREKWDDLFWLWYLLIDWRLELVQSQLTFSFYLNYD